jgi:hypothetical protein
MDATNGSSQIAVRELHTLEPAKSRVRDEPLNVKPENVICAVCTNIIIVCLFVKTIENNKQTSEFFAFLNRARHIFTITISLPTQTFVTIAFEST